MASRSPHMSVVPVSASQVLQKDPQWTGLVAPCDAIDPGELKSEVGRLSDELAQVSRRLGYVVGSATGSNSQSVRTTTDTELSDRVAHAILARQQRIKFFAAELFSDPVWDMLIEIFLGELLQRRTTISCLCIASQVPPTTALRWIRILTERGMFIRRPDPLDRRRVFIELSHSARTALHSYFESIPA